MKIIFLDFDGVMDTAYYNHILSKIGCQYELAEEEGDDRIFFAYQGEL